MQVLFQKCGILFVGVDTMRLKSLSFHVGLRTAKTALAVIISLVIVSAFGASDSRLIFALLGAMNAVQPTFKDSVQASLTQIVGVIFGVGISILLLFLPIPRLLIAGIGIVLVITLYNAFHFSFSPGLPCLLVVLLCTAEGLSPIQYGLGRIWDTTIGLVVGMVINMLVFPYDNSLRIRQTARSLDKELLHFLEDMFDGDTILPDAGTMTAKIDDLGKQLTVFSNQRLFLRLRAQHRELAQYKLCQQKARSLLAQMEVLSSMEKPGCLSAENRQKLMEAGAAIRDTRGFENPSELDVVTNYHVAQILTIRQQLLETLK